MRKEKGFPKKESPESEKGEIVDKLRKYIGQKLEFDVIWPTYGGRLSVKRDVFEDVLKNVEESEEIATLELEEKVQNFSLGGEIRIRRIKTKEGETVFFDPEAEQKCLYDATGRVLENQPKKYYCPFCYKELGSRGVKKCPNCNTEIKEHEIKTEG